MEPKEQPVHKARKALKELMEHKALKELMAHKALKECKAQMAHRA